jgi:uncharacterized protein YqjF (DUF2071 family)
MAPQSIFLRANWQHLLMANYVVDPVLIRPYLPYGTEPDTFNGEHYISLVGFEFNNTLVKGIGFPWHKNFVEINLRAYVKRTEGTTIKRGVVFIKEIVPKPLITWIANIFYHERYVTMPTTGGLFSTDQSDFIGYRWGDNNYFEAKLGEERKKLVEGSVEEFITEHYWGYASINKDSSLEYAVEHPRWETRDVLLSKLKVNFTGLYGKQYAFLHTTQPQSILYACGSNVLVRHPRKIK